MIATATALPLRDHSSIAGSLPFGPGPQRGDSLRVSSSTRLPPAASAGATSGSTTVRKTRNGPAPRLAATSNCSRGMPDSPASSGRTTNGVKKVISARITPSGEVNSCGTWAPWPATAATIARSTPGTAVQEGERQGDQEGRHGQHAVDQAGCQTSTGGRHERQHQGQERAQYERAGGR
jgi:hypothetical protein